MTLRGKKYSGDIYARKFGSSDAFVKMGNVSELTTSQEMETDTLPSTGKYDYGQAIEAEVRPQPTEITLKFNSFDKHALARALMGEAVDFASQVQTLTDVAGVVALGGYIKLAHDDIDPKTFVIKNKAQAVIEPEHYELLADVGLLAFKDSANVKAGEAFTYSAKTLGSGGFSIDANTLQSFDLEIFLDGRDRITGKNGSLTIPHAKLSADSELNWFSEDWLESGLTGTIIKEEGKAGMTFKEFA